MKRLLLLIACVCFLCSCNNGSSKNQTETPKITEVSAVTEKVTETVESIDKSKFIEHVKNEVEKSGLLLTFPDDDEWTVLPYDGDMSVSVTALKEKEECIVTAWVSMDNATIHYLDTKYGVIIDDGTIED